MKTYSIRSAREHLAELADLAEKGEAVRIERKGRVPLVLIAERDFRAPSERFLAQLDLLRQQTGGAEIMQPAGRPTSRRKP